jgi:RND family efflux transporter MFP subunit
MTNLSESARKARLWKVTVAAIVLLAVSGWAYRLLRGSDTNSPAAATAVTRVDVTTATQQPLTAYVETIGTLFPRSQATIGAKLGGQITKMPLLKNRTISEGEVIATFQAADLAAQRAEAAAALEQARVNQRTLVTATMPQNAAAQEKALQDARANTATAQALVNSRQQLYAEGALSKKDLEAAQLALTLATDDLRLAERNNSLRTTAADPSQRALADQQVTQAQEHLAQLDAQLSYAVIRAPFRGAVTEQFQFEGDYVPAGAKLVTLADLSEVIVKAAFADTVAAKLHVGSSVLVLPADVSSQQLMGTVSLISNSIDPTNRTVELWIRLPNDRGALRSGGSARVRVAQKTVDQALVVPATAVTLDASTGDSGIVMVVDAQSIAHERKVMVGIRANNLMEISSGLKPGEIVVTNGAYALPDGTKVQTSSTGSSGATGK